jgi:hypothetical protein
MLNCAQSFALLALLSGMPRPAPPLCPVLMSGALAPPLHSNERMRGGACRHVCGAGRLPFALLAVRSIELLMCCVAYTEYHISATVQS